VVFIVYIGTGHKKSKRQVTSRLCFSLARLPSSTLFLAYPECLCFSWKQPRALPSSLRTGRQVLQSEASRLSPLPLFQKRSFGPAMFRPSCFAERYLGSHSATHRRSSFSVAMLDSLSQYSGPRSASRSVRISSEKPHCAASQSAIRQGCIPFDPTSEAAIPAS